MYASTQHNAQPCVDQPMLGKLACPQYQDGLPEHAADPSLVHTVELPAPLLCVACVSVGEEPEVTCKGWVGG